jgi:hypothetical protein
LEISLPVLLLLNICLGLWQLCMFLHYSHRPVLFNHDILCGLSVYHYIGLY